MYLVMNHNTKEVLYQNESRGKCNQWILKTYPSYYMVRDNGQGKSYNVRDRMLPFPLRIVEVDEDGRQRITVGY